MLGLKEKYIEEILKVFEQFPKIESAIIFGSRALDKYKSGSDVDIAIKGTDLSLEDILKISWMLNEETMIPLRLEVVDYKSITNKNLIDHIDSVGKEIYNVKSEFHQK